MLNSSGPSTKNEGVNVKMPKNHSYHTYDLHYLSATTAAFLLEPILADPTFIGIIPIRPTFSKAPFICLYVSRYTYALSFGDEACSNFNSV